MGQIANEIENMLSDRKAGKELKKERRIILDQIAADEATKTNLVKKALAAQRAKYGAAGMGGKGMTEEAVLKRMREETEQPFDEKRIANMNKMSNLKKPKKTNLVKLFNSQFSKLIG
ncbi:MAG: hypothetical protein FWG39_00280 [Alphaproteobacteria bacterium]|nr:hypothetical protein [Alphaproteobacteria bacterium]